MLLSLFYRSFIQAEREVENSFTTNEGLLVIIPNINVEDMNRSIELSALVVEIF